MTGLILHPLRLKALSEGRLSVLRVPFREQPSSVEYWLHGLPAKPSVGNAVFRDKNGQGWSSGLGPFKPPYVPGDYFVKEAWTTRDQIWDGDKPEAFMIPAIVDPSMIIYRINDPAVKRKWRNPLSMPEWASRYILTLGPPVPGKLGEVDENTIYAEGVYFPPPYIGVNYEDGSAIEHPDIAMDPWQHHERFWNAIYPRHPWSPDRWTWAYPVKWRKR